MEKLKKYNQILLAILATVGLLFLLGFGIMAITEYLSFYSYDDHEYEPGLIAETKTDSLIKEEKREQILTFNQFVEIDTIKKIYIIPIGQKNLNEPESMGDDVLGLINSYPGRNVKGYRNKYGLNYNNLVLFESGSNRTKLIFDTRISISNFYSFNNGQYLIIRCAKLDTNKDEYIDRYDLQEMYLYDVRNNELHRIEKQENTSYINFANGINNSALVFQFGIDRNMNGEFNNEIEPKIYYRLNVETRELNLLIPESQINQIQELLEGRKSSIEQ
ncbi:MAG: hypothetical protein DWQ02_23710 [Bacteroidetes bacterium]|nr:MAG: hypothetical protein DWQ02_23710 [Bacteroidota bacterium]